MAFLLAYRLVCVAQLTSADVFLSVCQELKHENIVGLLDFQVCVRDEKQRDVQPYDFGDVGLNASHVTVKISV